MNIRDKLLSRYFLIALLTVGISYFSITSIHNIGMSYVEIADETIPMIASLENLRFACLRLLSSTKEAALISRLTKGTETDTAIDKEIDLIETGIKKYENALKKYTIYIKLFPNEQSLFDTIKKNSQLLIASSAKIMRAIANGVSDSELYELKENFKKYEKDTLKAIDAALINETHEINERKESVTYLLHNSELIIMFACIISFIVAIVFGFVSAVNISRPIRKLNLAMEEVGRGDLTVKTEAESNDEIGSLSLTFNKMTVDLREYEKTTHKSTY